jgi:hypothetical protein
MLKRKNTLDNMFLSLARISECIITQGFLSSTFVLLVNTASPVLCCPVSLHTDILIAVRTTLAIELDLANTCQLA